MDFGSHTDLYCLPTSRKGGKKKAPAGFALKNTSDDRIIQQNLVPLSPDSPDAIFVPFTSRVTKMGIAELDS